MVEREDKPLAQVEADGDDGGYVGRVAVYEIGPVAPLVDGVLGGAAKQVRAIENAGG